MQEYINLINFLKENDESVRKDLEILKFGTEISWCDDRYHIWDKLNIIWNNLDYHHLMKYCKHKNIWIIIDDDTINLNSKFWTLDLWNTLVKVDNTKPLNEQKSEVYKALLDYFISIK